MEIQEETLQPADPLVDLDEDYHHAVLHLAWDLQRETSERTLLFAFVELLPTEIPPPKDDYDPLAPRCGHRLGHDSKHRVYVRHAVLPARQARDWYLACRQGVALLPSPDGAVPTADDASATRLTLAKLGEEPQWPTLISASDEADTLPFVSQWIEQPRTHHLLPLVDFDRKALWTEKEQEAALSWLSGRLHFELADYPEYLGSIHLIAPNPVYRGLHTPLQTRAPTTESVLLRFQPRANKSVMGLELAFREKEPWGVTAARHTTVRSSVVRMNFDREVNAVMDEVWDPRRGHLKVSHEAHTFIQSIHIGLGLMEKTVVQMNDESYEVMRSGKHERSVIGTEHTVSPARIRMVVAYHERKKRNTASAHDQRWFRDQRDDARKLLQGILNEANSQVLIIDPYFGAEELAGFALAVGRTDIPIHILSSAELLKEPAGRESALEKGEQLLATLRQIEAHEHMNPFEIRVMAGGRPAVHDRFLSIDERIWLLGSSLNEFGSRGTMMLALPDPDAVRGDLTKAWEQSEPLEGWVERRRVNRRKGEGVGP